MDRPNTQGEADIAAAALALGQHLPEPLRPLARLAYNYWWAWNPPATALFADVDAEQWTQCARNPVRLLQEADSRRLDSLATDVDFLRRSTAIVEAFDAYLASGTREDTRLTAYFCAEFGVHSSLPFYAGGLGVLAGDFLKECSDQRLPLVGVGLFYRQGSFHQRFDISGWQQEYWLQTDSERLPAAVVRRADGEPLLVAVSIGGENVDVRVWRTNVGRVPLFLLDTDLASNSSLNRWITARLYVGDREVRIAQYAVLGICGVRALEAMGIEAEVFHLNEGHAALATLELRGRLLRQGATPEEAIALVRERTVFTTHTPVTAGNESFALDEVRRVLPDLDEQTAATWGELAAWGATPGEPAGAQVGVTPLALRMAGLSNGVSRLHGEVARQMWAGIWPGVPPGSAPIEHITNGVHLPTWMAPEMQELFDRHLPGWRDGRPDDPVGARILAIPDEELWRVRTQLRARLAATVRERSVGERLGRGERMGYAELILRDWTDDALTIGFARRIATYKRLYLLTRQPERAAALLTGRKPVQIVIAGRAHPSDDAAKRTVQELFAMNDIPGVGGRAVVLEDHDMFLAARLVQGCDLWVNLPRPTQEASGTSGMKSAANGGIQLSVLDGWWAEAWNGSNGWAIPSDPRASSEEQDAEDVETFMRLIETEVIPAFYERDSRGIPVAWVRRMKAALVSVVPQYSSARMVREYTARLPTAPLKVGDIPVSHNLNRRP